MLATDIILTDIEGITTVIALDIEVIVIDIIVRIGITVRIRIIVLIGITVRIGIIEGMAIVHTEDIKDTVIDIIILTGTVIDIVNQQAVKDRS